MKVINIGAEAVLRIRNRRIRIISLDPVLTKTIETEVKLIF